MKPLEIEEKVLDAVRNTIVKTGLGISYIDLKNEIGLSFEELKPVMRKLTDEKKIVVRKGLNSILIYLYGKKK